MGRVLKAGHRPAPPPVAQTPPADEEAAAIFERARREGFAAGQAEGVARGAALLSDAHADAQRALAALAPAALALARRMAEKIIGRAVEVDERAMAEIAAQALGACRPDVRAVRLRVHPDDWPAIQAHRDRLAARVPAAAVDIVADPAVGRHGCVVDTPRGRIDARLDAQLAALERAMLDEGAGA